VAIRARVEWGADGKAGSERREQREEPGRRKTREQDAGARRGSKTREQDAGARRGERSVGRKPKSPELSTSVGAFLDLQATQVASDTAMSP